MMKLAVFVLCAAQVLLTARGDNLALSGTWRLDYWPEPVTGPVRSLPIPTGLAVGTVDASVPGNCELDLVNAGILPPLELGLNVLKLRPYECYQWLYSRSFEAKSVPADGSKAELVFDGIDTLADVFLNGEKIGESANMFIPRRFDVTRCLRKGTNVVQVLLRSVLMDSRSATVGEMGGVIEPGGDGERYRKAAHMGGWDILPRAFVQGLWRDVRLEVSQPVRILELDWIVKRLDVSARRADFRFRARVEAPFETLDNSLLRLTLFRNGKVRQQTEKILCSYHPVVDFTLENADLWWPRGFGEPALYEAKAEIVAEDGTVRAVSACRLGVRKVELERDDVYGPDRPGQFLFKVNGEPCYIRGSNWVPLDALHGRDMARLEETLSLFADLNCNMVRVWGGGVYEPDRFFEWCDENGLMVWQDFMTGCGVFPQDDAYAAATREEVLSVVLRLRNHASLVLWSGNNENDQAFEWGVGPELARDPNRDRNSRRTIPDVLFEYDLTRPYLPSSPYRSPDVVAGKAKPSEDHLWGAREYYKVPYYTNSPCWFASEMGYHGCPNRASLEKMMTKDGLYPWKEITGGNAKRDYHWNDEWQLKACNPTFSLGNMRHATRNSLMSRHCEILFGKCPADLNDFIWQSQFAQAEAMKTFVELFRSRKFTRFNGLIWWNVRDGWPILSDAVVDYYGGKKRAYYAIRNVQHDQLVMVRDDHRVFAVNDTLKPVDGWTKIVDRESGKVLLEKSYSVPKNAAVEIGVVEWSRQGVLDIAYEQGGEKHTNWFLYGEPPFDFKKVKAWMD